MADTECAVKAREKCRTEHGGGICGSIGRSIEANATAWKAGLGIFAALLGLAAFVVLLAKRK